MGTGWRRAFCTTVSRDRDARTTDSDKHHHHHHQQRISCSSPSPSPRSCVKLSFLSGGSNPSTPRPVSTKGVEDEIATTPIPRQLQCKTTSNTPRSAAKSPKPVSGSNPSSPRSPLKLSLFRNSFKFRSSCGICLNSVKTGQGMAIYTAECSHAFHFPCIADYVRKHGKLVCPVCSAVWKDASLLAAHKNLGNDGAGFENDAVATKPEIEEKRVVDSSPRVGKIVSGIKEEQRKLIPKISDSRYYNDDEPLLSPRFVPIPEENGREEEEEDEGGNDDVEEFQGFVVNPNPSFSVKSHEIPISGQDLRNVQVRLLPENALVSAGRGYETYAVALRVKAPPPRSAAAWRGAGALLDPSHRAPVDLVTVLDVGGTVNAAKLHMLKRAMYLVISSLGSADRLSIVAFSATTKRLLPLKRMTDQGRRAARRVVDRLVCGQGTNVSDALRKASRVLEDRRERNPVASIILLSDGQDQKVHSNIGNQRYNSGHVASTRFAHIEIPVHESGFGESGGCSHEPAEEAFAKCVGGLLNVVVQDLRIQLGVGAGSAPCEISAVYLCNGGPALVGSGSGSVRLGDLYADEERELLVELRVPATACGARHVLSVRCLFKDPSTQEVVYGRDQALVVPPAVRSSSPKIERLRNLFIATRAVAESRRLVDHAEFTSAHHLLASARALLIQSGSVSANEYIKGLEAELAEVHWRKQQLIEHQQHQQQMMAVNQRRRGNEREMMVLIDENGEPLTPTSAWRAAEKLAKVAMMKKSLNSDLHGFENARF